MGEVWVAIQKVDGGYYDQFVGVAATREGAKALCDDTPHRWNQGKPIEWDDDPYGTGSGRLSISEDEGFTVGRTEVKP